MFLANSLCFKDKTIIEEIFEQTQLLKLEKKVLKHFDFCSEELTEMIIIQNNVAKSDVSVIDSRP